MTDIKNETVKYGANTKPICPKCKSDQVVRDACGDEIGGPAWVTLRKPEIIRLQNDRFRKSNPDVPGRRLLTSGIQDLIASSGQAMEQLVEAVAAFDTFTQDNDPHREHGFGKFTFEGKDCFWKIDCYNRTLNCGSEDPSVLTQSQRVMTIMLAQEY